MPQAAWAETGTVRDNIVFQGAGAPCDDFRFAAALDAACLGTDLARMPDGADTLLGERGGTVSGGQRHRIALARAHYSHADAVVVFLDATRSPRV